MRNYEFKLLTGDRTVKSSTSLSAISDDDACAIAEDLLADSDFAMVEVFRDSEMVARLLKLDAQPANTPKQ